MNDNEINFWLDLSQEISKEVEKAINKARNDPELNNVTKIGADGTPTHKIDEYAEDAAISVIENCEKSLILISEEIGTIKIGDNKAEAVLIMDPLDGTSNALKNIPCYGISIAIAKISDETELEHVTLGDVEIGFIKNFPTGDEYISIKGKGSTKNGEAMTISSIPKVSEATVSTYVYRAKEGELDKLCTSVRRMRLMGAIAIEMCYVADGTYDVFLDIGAVRVFDIAAAQLIIKENEGIVTDVNANLLESQLDLMETTSIIAAANPEIHEDLIKLLN
ncbi:bifunctional fructose-bisphosphatase/inositol-phosphate phosphatase [Methanosphaera sp. WGK6]|uniref:bifunctional fructose-bisphosphatase/inositol-phosphate phosphatase n=1 Tax=Methanosphaera sp. WGK6 TaxID=1561964 RepID=UPI00084CAD33|nr:bifunctional fructose-bisphosphatase/inositol-phosphate phosphatase [Methanosphaera sp. WGK6]OED30613.1 hypothetical protein NL43_01320 [Methanosphaera sp. WGK6]